MLRLKGWVGLTWILCTVLGILCAEYDVNKCVGPLGLGEADTHPLCRPMMCVVA